eukprot:2704329-Rhodomonas_salina.1
MKRSEYGETLFFRLRAGPGAASASHPQPQPQPRSLHASGPRGTEALARAAAVRLSARLRRRG